MAGGEETARRTSDMRLEAARRLAARSRWRLSSDRTNRSSASTRSERNGNLLSGGYAAADKRRGLCGGSEPHLQGRRSESHESQPSHESQTVPGRGWVKL